MSQYVTQYSTLENAIHSLSWCVNLKGSNMQAWWASKYVIQKNDKINLTRVRNRNWDSHFSFTEWNANSYTAHWHSSFIPFIGHPVLSFEAVELQKPIMNIQKNDLPICFFEN